MRRLALAVAVTAACSDLSGLSGASGGGGDAGAEGGGTEAGAPPPPVGQPDASACDADFCEPFDDPSYAAQWTDTVKTAAVAALDTAVAVQGPSSLHVTAAPEDGGVDSTFHLRKFIAVPKRLGCSFHLRTDVDRSATHGSQDVFVLEAASSAVEKYYLRFGFADQQMELREDVSPCNNTCPRKTTRLPNVTVARWVKVQIETDFASASVLVDGVPVATGAWVGFVPETLAVRIGVQNVSDTAADVHVDDLRCTFTK